MKHMKVLSNEMPAEAQYTAWVQFKQVFGVVPLDPAGGNTQALWVLSQIDQALQK